MKNTLQSDSVSLFLKDNRRLRAQLVGAGLLFLFFSLSSCKELQPVTMGGVENPHLISLSKAGVEFEFGMKIKNPNHIGVTVFPSSFDATVNGMDVGKIKLDKKVRIKANSDEAPVFHIKSDFSKLGLADIANVLPMIASKRAEIALKGNIRVGKWYYKKKFPVEFKKNIAL